MATGRLGVQDLTASTDTTVYTVPVGTYAVANVSITNSLLLCLNPISSAIGMCGIDFRLLSILN